jgi:ribonucleoside-diphosphate reductase alpha chain
VETLVRKFAFMRFEPEGITTNPEIPFAKSLPDYIMRWVASRFLDPETKAELGILTLVEEDKPSAPSGITPLADTPGLPPDGAAASLNGNGHKAVLQPAAVATLVAAGGNGHHSATYIAPDSAGMCGQCGSMMVRTGSCTHCSSCPNSQGGCG